MKKRWLLAGFAGVLIAFFGVAAVHAESVDQKINNLEQQLSQLKSQQIEMKKDAAAAAAALPTFSYRPGSGVSIAASDRSWELGFKYEFHVHMYNHIDGDPRNHSSGDLFFRRNRPYITYCWADCFYEIVFGWDMDTGDITNEQNTGLYVHLEQMNPMLPTLWVTDKGGQSASYVGRSSSSSAIVELTRDLLADNDYSTLSHRAIGFGWINAPLGRGDFLLDFEYKPGAGIEKNKIATSDRKQFSMKAGMRPFRKIKNKWIRGLKFGFGMQTDSVDTLETNSETGKAEGNNRLRLRTNGDRPRRLAVLDAKSIGPGQHYNWQYGLEWVVGPYTLRSEDGYATFDNGSASSVKGYFWSIAHELFLWSPKGFLTGSSRRAGSVQMGFEFARADASCDASNFASGCVKGDTVHQNHLILRQLALWYYIRPRLSVGTWWNMWSTPNMPTEDQNTVGCVKSDANAVAGKACTWHELNLGLRMNF